MTFPPPDTFTAWRIPLLVVATNCVLDVGANKA
jgi:hypothetical protein